MNHYASQQKAKHVATLLGLPCAQWINKRTTLLGLPWTQWINPCLHI